MAKSNNKLSLGKGLGALLGGIKEEYDDNELEYEKDIERDTLGNTSRVKLDNIEVNPFQPRVNFDEQALEDLSNSIKIHGVIQPITVRVLSKDKYQLISGERRLRASKMAGLTDVPVYVRAANDQEALEIALIENIQREDLNAIEIGINYQRLLDECNLSHESLAERVGKKRATVSNYLRLLKLPPDIQVGIRSNELSMGHARAIAGVDDVMIQLSLYKDVISKGLSVRQIEEIVSKLATKKGNGVEKKTTPVSVNPVFRKYQDMLASHFSTKATIKSTGEGRGEIVLNFYTEDDLERIIGMCD
jgi:ParB family transcriptional regulator, chromosome partitioning protein